MLMFTRAVSAFCQQRLQRLRLLLVLILGPAVLLGTASSHVLGAVTSDDNVALQVAAKLNAWRIREGLSPLKPNATLRAMAIDQATYLVSLPELPGGEDGADIHLDQQGRTPPQRAIQPPYNWPSYGRPDRTAIGENAAVGTIDFALYFWSKSDIHRRAALNPAYREVGVAAVPYGNGYLFIVDFGARPNVLPAFISPTEHALYLTNEQYRWKSGGDWVQNAKQVQFLDENDVPFHSEPVVWQQKLVLDKTWGSRFKVLYIDGKTKTTVSVDLNDDLAVLPDTLTAQVAAVPTSVETPIATEAAVAPTKTASETVQPTPQPTNGPTPTLTEEPATATAQTDLVLYYDSVSLTLLNNTKNPVNLTMVNFKYGDKYLGADRWGKVVPAPINAFPAGQCLEIISVAENPIKPEVCSYVRSILEFSSDRLFWAQEDFDVLRGDKVLVTCKKGAGRCEVPWPR